MNFFGQMSGTPELASPCRSNIEPTADKDPNLRLQMLNAAVQKAVEARLAALPPLSLNSPGTPTAPPIAAQLPPAEMPHGASTAAAIDVALPSPQREQHRRHRRHHASRGALVKRALFLQGEHHARELAKERAAFRLRLAERDAEARAEKIAAISAALVANRNAADIEIKEQSTAHTTEVQALQSLLDKARAEASAAASATAMPGRRSSTILRNAAVSYFDRLCCFYRIYNPDKLSHVAVTLSKFFRREEHLFDQLDLKYASDIRRKTEAAFIIQVWWWRALHHASKQRSELHKHQQQPQQQVQRMQQQRGEGDGEPNSSTWSRSPNQEGQSVNFCTFFSLLYYCTYICIKKH